MKDDVIEGLLGLGSGPRARISHEAPSGGRGTALPLPALHWESDPVDEVWDALDRTRRLGPRNDPTQRSGLPLAQLEAADRAFDNLRTQLGQALQTEGLTRIAVVGPTSGAGATFTAVNLALSFARVPGFRTVLMDVNQRAPGVAQALNVAAEGDIADYLTGGVSTLDHVRRHARGLALAMTKYPRRNASDILQSRLIEGTLNELEGLLEPNLVLVDLPPMLVHDDASAFLPHVDGVLVVSDGSCTTARQLTECERLLSNRTRLMGVTLNRARPERLGWLRRLTA